MSELCGAEHVSRLPKDAPLVTSNKQPGWRLLCRLEKRRSAVHTDELGPTRGRTCFAGGRHYLVEALAGRMLAKGTSSRAGFGELIEFHAEPSHSALPSLVRMQRRVDFALIDGWHTFDYVMVDFFYVDLLLKAGGIVMLDDTGACPAIRKVARYIATHRRYAPIDNGIKPITSTKRRALNATAALLSAPPLRAVTKYLLRPDMLHPDAALGLPGGNFIAFRKLADDTLGDGSADTRKWDQHVDF